MNTILLCTDCSENAKKAVDRCIYLFKNQRINYILLYTYTVADHHISNLVAQNDVVKLNVTESLEKELQRIKQLSYFTNSTITSRAIFGKTENVINRFIAKSKVDLIVMGSQGTNFSEEQLFGTTTNKIVHEVYCPKLIVPNQDIPLNRKTKVLFIQANQLKDLTWWSTITTLAGKDTKSFKLVILPNSDQQKITVSIPETISKEVNSIIDFSSVDTTEVSDKLHHLLKEEQPDLLYLNIKDRHLGNHLLSKSSPLFSAFSSIPFVIEPFVG